MDQTLTEVGFTVDDPETENLVRQFARERSVGLAEAIKLAVLEARRAKAADRARMEAAIREVQDRVASYGETGLVADKAFYDSLNDEED